MLIALRDVTHVFSMYNSVLKFSVAEELVP